MTYLVTGRASKIEERGIRNEELVAAGLPKLPSIFKRTPTKTPEIIAATPQPALPKGPHKFQDGVVPISYFAREYQPQKPAEPPLRFERPKPTARNFFHECPVLDMANKGTLMAGEDETETFIQNGLAASLLGLVRDCMDTVSTDFYGPDVAGRDGIYEGTWGYGMDSVHDNGPGVMSKTPRFKTLWEHGSKAPASLGKPWSLGAPAQMAGNADGITVPVLRQVGLIEFKKPGYVSFLTHKGKTIRYETRIRAPKGKKDEEGPESLTGHTAPNHGKVDEMSGTTSTNRPPMNENHPMVVWEKVEREREYAHSVLNKLESRLTPKLYNAVVEAATGATLDQIGRGHMPGLSRNDKRPGTAGKVLIVTALDILFRDDSLKIDLNLTLKLAA